MGRSVGRASPAGSRSGQENHSPAIPRQRRRHLHPRMSRKGWRERPRPLRLPELHWRRTPMSEDSRSAPQSKSLWQSPPTCRLAPLSGLPRQTARWHRRQYNRMWPYHSRPQRRSQSPDSPLEQRNPLARRTRSFRSNPESSPRHNVHCRPVPDRRSRVADRCLSP